jgi:hypothetical protein
MIIGCKIGKRMDRKRNGYNETYAECGCMSDLGNKVSKAEMEGTTVPAG